jgi:hypothetical protein
MPRSGGVYTLPAGNPVVTLTTISSTWANTTMSDIATALTGSLPTDGSAPMSGVLRLADGVVGAPGLTWASETTSGFYRIGLNQFGFSLAGVAALTVNANRGWTIPAPAAGVALTATGIANQYGIQLNASSTSGQSFGQSIVAGTTSADIALNVQNQAATAQFLRIFGDGHGTLGPSSSLGLNWSAAGNVTIAAPSSGTSLTVNTVGANTCINLNGPSATNLSMITATQTGQASVLLYNPASTNDFRVFLNGADRVAITGSGNVTIAAPSSGIALQVGGVAGQTYLNLGSTADTTPLLGITGAAVSHEGIVLNANGVQAVEFAQNFSGSTDSFGMTTGSYGIYGFTGTGSLVFGTNSTLRMSINNSGAVTIASPGAGNQALTVTGIANQYTVAVQGSATASQSYGILIQAGTNSTDQPFAILNTSASTALFRIFGDGSVVVGNPTGGTQGLGTINATGLFVNGVSAVPTYAYKAATTTRTNNAVQSADPDLTFSCVSGHKYAFKMLLGINGGAGGLTANLGGTAVGATALAIGYGKINSAAFPGTPGAALNNSLVNVAAVGGNDYLVVDASFTCTTSGTVFLNWSQNNSNAAGTAIIASSYGVMTQLS